MSVPGEWYRDWFGETYLRLYPHRDEEEAETAVRLFRRTAGTDPAAAVLDVACGAGRHVRAFLQAGHPAVGVDLSPALLREARAAGAGTYVRGDMRRLPFRAAAFSGLTNFFTSFGYFSTREEDERAAREMARVLRPEGGFLLDYLNASQVRAALVSEDEREVSGTRVLQRRWMEGGSVVKRIELRPTDGPARVHFERVRLYEPEELEDLLDGAGLRPLARFGDYEGGPHGPDAPRLIVVGERPRAGAPEP